MNFYNLLRNFSVVFIIFFSLPSLSFENEDSNENSTEWTQKDQARYLLNINSTLESLRVYSQKKVLSQFEQYDFATSFKQYTSGIDNEAATLIQILKLKKLLSSFNSKLVLDFDLKPELLDKKFTQGDHSIEATRFKFKIKAGTISYPMSAICITTFNCLNEIDSHYQCYLDARSI